MYQMNHLKNETNLFSVKNFSTYRAVNTFRVGYKIKPVHSIQRTNWFFLRSTEHANTLCGQNVEFVTVKSGSVYSNHLAAKRHTGHGLSTCSETQQSAAIPVLSEARLRY
jgi:hypothetical protein